MNFMPSVNANDITRLIVFFVVHIVAPRSRFLRGPDRLMHLTLVPACGIAILSKLSPDCIDVTGYVAYKLYLLSLLVENYFTTFLDC